MFDIKNRLIVWNVCVCFWLLRGCASGETDYDRSNQNLACSKEELRECESKAYDGADKSVLNRMPVSEEEIVSSCRVFNAVMKCFNDYVHKCLDKNARKYMERDTSTARQIYHRLCNDKRFQSEYLNHKACLKATQQEWKDCVNKFQELVSDIKSEENKRNASQATLEKCCALHGFKGCIYVPSRLKCFRDSAIFVHDLTEQLIYTSETNVQFCQNIVDQKICSGCANSISLSVLTLSFLFLRHYC